MNTQAMPSTQVAQPQPQSQPSITATGLKALEAELGDAADALRKQPATPGSEMLSNTAAAALAGAHSHIVTEIDNMIVRLQNMKASVQLKREKAENELRDFITMVGHSHDCVKDLEQIVGGIESKHL